MLKISVWRVRGEIVPYFPAVPHTFSNNKEINIEVPTSEPSSVFSLYRIVRPLCLGLPFRVHLDIVP